MAIGAGVGMEIWSADSVCPQGRVRGRCRNGLNSPGSEGQKSLFVSFTSHRNLRNEDIPSKDNT